MLVIVYGVFFFFQAEDGIRDIGVTGVQTCALPILTVMRPPGNTKPEFTIAARTRSRASRTALSASPTTVNAGRPERTSASTSTRRASTPSRANGGTRASTPERVLEVVEPHEAATAVQHGSEGVEAQLHARRSVVDLREPGRRHPADLPALRLGDRLPRGPGAAPRLDFDEHDRVVVGR